MSKYKPERTAPGAHLNNRYAARIWIENQRWSGKPECPHCGAVDEAYLLEPDNKSRKRRQTFRTLKCTACEEQFTATTKTEFDGLRDLHKWLAAKELLHSEPEISQRDLARLVGVNRDTAANMKRRILGTSEER